MSSQTHPPAAPTGTPPPSTSRSTIRLILFAVGAGHFVEWFDMGIYGTLSTYLASHFFAQGNPTAALLSTFAVFAVGFFIRPIGGLILGPMGDRLGRRRALVIVIVMTSLSTAVIGVLPTYSAVGTFAVVLLVIARLVQGFAAGGEVSNAITLLYEYAPKHRRGLMTSSSDSFGYLAFVIGAGLVLALNAGLGARAMAEWGWRVPFLCALPLGLVGLYLRLRLTDTPVFRQLEASGTVARNPLREGLKAARTAMYVLAGVAITKGAANWMLETFLVSYLQNSLHFDQTASFAAVTPCLALVMIVTPLMGMLGDKIGRKPLLIAATAGFVILSWPVFILMSQKTLTAALIAILVLGLLTAIFCGAVNATMASLFPPRFRSGGIAAPYNIAASICGGGAPFIATWLVAATGYTPSPAFYLMAVAAITLVTVVFAVKDKPGREEITTVAV